MILIHVSVQTKESVTDEFEQRLRQVVNDASQAAGCIVYEWYYVPETSGRYVIYAEFDSKKNFEAYLNSAIVKRIGDELIPLLISPPQFKHFAATVIDSD